MSRQLKSNEWIYYFNLYEKNLHQFQSEYELLKQKPFKNNVKAVFIRKYRIYKYNDSVDVLISKTGKAPKKGKGVGRKMKKPRIDSSYIEKEDLDKILDHYYEIINEDKNNEHKDKFKRIIKDSSASLRQWASTGFITKSSAQRLKTKSENINEKDFRSNLKSKILEILNKYKWKIGREVVAQHLKNDYGINLSGRQIGRYLNEMGYICKIRKSSNRTKKEAKNTKINIPDLVLRDYDNKNHHEEIISTDVTYLSAPKDVHQNHVYLSIAISHKTKQIISYNLSQTNDVNYIMDHFVDLNFNHPVIIHSDHELQYSSEIFQNLCKIKGWKQSMSRVGNSLDNREAEHFFGTLKTEFYYLSNTKEMTWNQLKNKIDNFIKYYNEKRIQKNLNWLIPNEFFEIYHPSRGVISN